jgi:hypothetical protein
MGPQGDGVRQPYLRFNEARNRPGPQLLPRVGPGAGSEIGEQ